MYFTDNMDLQLSVGSEEFVSKKATNKLVQQTKVNNRILISKNIHAFCLKEIRNKKTLKGSHIKCGQLNMTVLAALQTVHTELQTQNQQNLFLNSIKPCEIIVNGEQSNTFVMVSFGKFVEHKISVAVVIFQDPLVLASNALPGWCESMTKWCPMLFTFDTRQLYFTCTAFGTSR